MIRKELIQSFDVAFCYRDTMLSESIAAATGSQFSHTAHFIWEGDELFVYDAQIDGYYPKRYEDWVEKYGYTFIIMYNPNLTEPFISNCIARTEKIVGKKYDAFSLLVRKPVNIGRRYANIFRRKNKGEWTANPKKQLEGIYCSEGTAYVMQRSRIDVSPAELFTDMTLDGYRVRKEVNV